MTKKTFIINIIPICLIWVIILLLLFFLFKKPEKYIIENKITEHKIDTTKIENNIYIPFIKINAVNQEKTKIDTFLYNNRVFYFILTKPRGILNPSLSINHDPLNRNMTPNFRTIPKF
jgi:hypothetical protein